MAKNETLADMDVINELMGETVIGSNPHQNDTQNMYIDPGPEEFEQLVDKLENLTKDGRIETVFPLGLSDSGETLGFTEEQCKASLETLKKVGTKLNAQCSVIRRRVVDGGHVSDVMFRKEAGLEEILEVRVAVVGNVDAGKSTMLGVLTRGQLDNGRGKARQNMFRHKHELDTGRTSSISHEILGFRADGTVCDATNQHKISWSDICSNSSKLITFIDLAGHEKYLKTTVFGLTGCAPDFAMLMIGANAGLVGMTKEHLGLALALNVPVFVCITKVDMCPENVLADTIKQLTRILRSAGCRKIPMFISSMEDVVVTATNFLSERVCPIFQVSNVTGQNLDLLRQFLNLLPAHSQFDVAAPAEFQIDDTFLVPGVGTIVSGTVMAGKITVGDNLYYGPDSLGRFLNCQIKSVHRKRVAVHQSTAGQSASFALKKIKRSAVRKGMVLKDKDSNPQACWEFDAEILILYHSTTITARYQAMMHCGNVRQTAGIIHMDKDVLRTGDRSIIRIRFLKQPEYINAGTRLLFREGRTKGVGKVIRTIPVGSPEEMRPRVSATSQQQQSEQKS
eukprot:Lithocolla_globosa_v1_NODE_2518_length_1966_cov_27.742543.p1 type:complete len:566 gc:universal NODE_2518_length_1966_cov_27.742543:236-1933(+)